ncbi:SIMPL domain-containing protein [Tsukamurella soli]|uniref:SIMPL domain-containing protein n=1 Tax=Tsukamurella soli TaxID=644556 RepID=A0ABP8JSW6_9ACTN
MNNDVEITVRGSHRVHAPAERGTVALTVALENRSAESVFAAVAQSAEILTERIRRLHDPVSGPVTWWSARRLETWARRPWNQDGKELPLKHHARVRFQVKFRDFDALSRFTADAIEVHGVEVDDTVWTLTEKRRDAVVSDVRAAAVRDARARAQAYADALALGPVVPVAIADPGMLGTAEPAGPIAEFRSAAMPAAPAGGGRQVSLTPEEITVEQQVDARFRLAPG